MEDKQEVPQHIVDAIDEMTALLLKWRETLSLQETLGMLEIAKMTAFKMVGMVDSEQETSE